MEGVVRLVRHNREVQIARWMSMDGGSVGGTRAGGE